MKMIAENREEKDADKIENLFLLLLFWPKNIEGIYDSGIGKIDTLFILIGS